jgi:hypothetical protein
MFRDSESELCVGGGVPVEGYARPLRTQLIVASADPQGLQTKGRSGISHLFNYFWVSFGRQSKAAIGSSRIPRLAMDVDVDRVEQLLQLPLFSCRSGCGELLVCSLAR